MAVPQEAIACTLASAGLATQSERWQHVRARAELERVATPDGLRMHFRAESGVEQELRELVAVENECCSWAAWTVEAVGNEAVLRIASTGEGVAVLHSMFGKGDPATSTACCSDG